MTEVLRHAGRYEVMRPVGSGGMAVVFLARQTDLDRFVALKELRLQVAPDQSVATRFLREAQTAGSLSHPNIVTVHEHFEYEGTAYIAMEYLERGSLRPYIGRTRLAQVAGLLEGVLAGLDHAAHHGVVHRDLKPENLMVTREGGIKIADFGIARARNRVHRETFATVQGTTVGTPTYMAPEQAMARDVGPYTDLYSVGVIAWELLVGQVPFAEVQEPMAILLRHIHDEIPRAHTVNPDVPPALSDWVARLLVKDWRARTPTAAQAWEELEDVVEALLGSRWRRLARLPELAQEEPTPGPLTPAHFTAHEQQDPGISGVFLTFSPDSARQLETPVVMPTAEVAEPPPVVAEEPEAAAAPEPQVAVPEPADANPEPAVANPKPAVAEQGPAAVTSEPAAAAPAAAEPAVSEPAITEPEPEPEDPEPAAAASEPVLPEPAAAAREPQNPVAEPEPEPAVAPPVPKRVADIPAAAEVAPEDEPTPRPKAPAPPSRRFKTVFPAPVPEPEPEPVAPEPPAPPPMAETLPPNTTPVPVPRPAPPEPAPAPPRHRRRVAVLAAVTVAAAVGGAVAGSGGDDPAPAPRTTAAVDPRPVRAVAAKAAGARVPSTWRTAQGTGASDLGLRDAVAAGPAGSTTRAGIVLGTVSGPVDPSLLPRTLAVDGEGKATPVRLAGTTEAVHHTGLRDGKLELYTVPTATGVVALACTGSAVGAPICGAIARTLTFAKGAGPVPLAPDAALAKRLGGALARLDSGARRDAKTLREAQTSKSQSSAAAALATDYRRAAAALAGRPTPAAAAAPTTALISTLRAVADGYDSAGSAARLRDRARYGRASARVKSAATRLAATRRALRAAGYDVASP